MDDEDRTMGWEGGVAPAPHGVDGETGQYATRDVSVEDFAAAVGEVPSPREVVHGGADLAEAGWAVVFAANDPTAAEARKALAPLLDRRKQQAGSRYRELVFEPGQSFRAWLKHHRVAPGSPDPDRVPEFLCLVGSPSYIPFEIQYLLDIEYAVGRLDFTNPAGYAAYAEAVVQHETRAPTAMGSKEIVYWGPRHDVLTTRTSDYLLRPLADGEGAGDPAAEGGVLAGEGYRTTKLFSNFDGVGSAGSKQGLMGAITRSGRERPPAMVFTASHGLCWKEGHPLQASTQGALITQEWTPSRPVEPEHYVAATSHDDLDDLSLQGSVVFMYACFGAGTPKLDGFRKRSTAPQRRLAEAPFTSALPQRLLSHPRGALAVISHVDRAWDYFVRPDGMGSHVGPFRGCIQSILAGHPVGRSTQGFSTRFSILSADIAAGLDPNAAEDPPKSDTERAWDFIERNDARSYVLLGDPAVEIRPELLS